MNKSIIDIIKNENNYIKDTIKTKKKIVHNDYLELSILNNLKTYEKAKKKVFNYEIIKDGKSFIVIHFENNKTVKLSPEIFYMNPNYNTTSLFFRYPFFIPCEKNSTK